MEQSSTYLFVGAYPKVAWALHLSMVETHLTHQKTYVLIMITSNDYYLTVSEYNE